jgi:hypothetical protein
LERKKEIQNRELLRPAFTGFFRFRVGSNIIFPVRLFPGFEA